MNLPLVDAPVQVVGRQKVLPISREHHLVDRVQVLCVALIVRLAMLVRIVVKTNGAQVVTHRHNWLTQNLLHLHYFVVLVKLADNTL